MSNEIQRKKKPQKTYLNLGLEVEHYTALVGISRKLFISEQTFIRALIINELKRRKLITDEKNTF